MPDITAMINDPNLYVNALAFLIGLIVHVAKTCYCESVSLKQYLVSHKTNTCISGTGLLTGFITLGMMYPGAPALIYGFGGYCIDNLLNKAPLSVEKVNNSDIIV